MIDCLEKKCTGCKMCGDLCSQKAITFRTDKEGFWYPSVDYSKCIKCGLCKAKCPVLEKNNKEKTFTAKGYAAWNRENEIRKESTSGGVYYAMAKTVVDREGYIVGSAYSKDCKSAVHISGNDNEAIKKICGSKYFQSDTTGIYRVTKRLLDDNKEVLFTGTPCQISALYSYLKKDYSNLITCDFICRGVPSPKLHKLRIEHYEKKYHSIVASYKDKDKEKNGWACFGEKIVLENGKKIFINRYKDWFNECFINYNFNIRPSCYDCNFKGNNHLADITIGDFWGITHVTDKDLRDGVSAVITNTEKGESFVKSLSDKLYLFNRSINSISEGNMAYYNSVEMPKEREDFFKDIDKYPIKKLIKKKCPENYIKKMVKAQKIILKNHLKQYKDLIKNFREINWFKFIKYNFMCKNVVRDKYCFIIPMGKCNICIEKEAEVILHGNVLLNYYPCYKTNSMSNFIVRNRAIFIANNRHELSYENTICVDYGAKFVAGYFFTGVGANVICHSDIEIGNNVMLGRDVCIFDSDYHSIYNAEFDFINPDKKVLIGDNVWIGAKSMVLKGSVIGNNAIIGANSMVTGEIEEDRCYINKKSGNSVGSKVSWQR